MEPIRLYHLFFNQQRMQSFKYMVNRLKPKRSERHQRGEDHNFSKKGEGSWESILISMNMAEAHVVFIHIFSKTWMNFWTPWLWFLAPWLRFGQNTGIHWRFQPSVSWFHWQSHRFWSPWSKLKRPSDLDLKNWMVTNNQWGLGPMIPKKHIFYGALLLSRFHFIHIYLEKADVILLASFIKFKFGVFLVRKPTTNPKPCQSGLDLSPGKRGSTLQTTHDLVHEIRKTWQWPFSSTALGNTTYQNVHLLLSGAFNPFEKY